MLLAVCRLDIKAESVGRCLEAQRLVKLVGFETFFIAEKLDLVAAGTTGTVDGMVHEKLAKPPAAIFTVNHHVLNDCPGKRPVREIGHYQQYRGADHRTVFLSYQELVTRHGQDFGGYPLHVIRRRVGLLIIR